MIRIHLHVLGTVQGVGLRAQVTCRARQLGLTGWVRSGPDGAQVEVQGPEPAVQALVDEVRALPPPARVEELRASPRAPLGEEREFRVLPSLLDGDCRPALADDLAICAACAAEVRDPGDRRHLHAFHACARCGPRTSIAQGPPFDRARTAMAGFPPCPRCAAELADPRDRRFLAQVGSCATCGPSLSLVDRSGARTTGAKAAIDAAVACLRDGGLVGLKGIGGFQLLCDPLARGAVARLRAAKGRPDQPLALLLPSLAVGLAHGLQLEPAAERLRSPAGPIVLVPAAPGPLRDAVAPGLAEVGVMLPTSALHLLLAEAFDGPLACASANRAGGALATTLVAALAELGADVDAWLDHDRPILRPLDDSVVRGASGPVLRRARGLSAAPLPLGQDGAVVLAVGAHLDVAPALVEGRRAWVAPSVGDLDGRGVLWRFGQACRTLLEELRQGPAALACDARPDLPSSRFAEALAAEHGVPLLRVAHAHAHVAAVVAERRLEGPVLGLTWDAPGLGEDGGAGGGEALLCHGAQAERVGHLLPFALPGGARAARHPARIALALLHGADAWDPQGPEAARAREALGGEVADALVRQLDDPSSATRAPFATTTSVGRLLDGLAWLLGRPDPVTWEGQAAGWLEALAGHDRDDAELPLPVRSGVADWRPLVGALVARRRRGEAPASLARAVHRALAAVAVDMAAAGPGEVVLAGSCFQAPALTDRVVGALRARGHRVHRAVLLPPGDGGIALGQAHLARLLLE